MGRLIHSHSFGNADGPHLLITGGVHGDEFEPMVAIRQLHQLFDSEEFGAATIQGKVTLVPCANFPAFVRGARCGDDQLDLARTCPGNAEGGVTEQIAFELSELIRAADFYVDLHTGGSEFRIHPFSGYTLHPEESVLRQQRMMASAFGLPIIWGTAPNLEGRTLSVARDAHVPAIYAEYLGGGACSQSGVEAYRAGCLNVIRSLGITKGLTHAEWSGLRVEDHTPGSGHLQVRHPSPLTGIFEPLVEVGQRVFEGQALGVVHSVDAMESRQILCDTTGLVLVIRSFPRIALGESAGVVLDDKMGLPVGADL